MTLRNPDFWSLCVNVDPTSPIMQLPKRLYQLQIQQGTESKWCNKVTEGWRQGLNAILIQFSLSPPPPIHNLKDIRDICSDDPWWAEDIIRVLFSDLLLQTWGGHHTSGWEAISKALCSGFKMTSTQCYIQDRAPHYLFKETHHNLEPKPEKEQQLPNWALGVSRRSL